MAKETETEKEERLLLQRATKLTVDLLSWLLRESAPLDTLGLSPREKDVLTMKWKYGLKLDQIAANLSISRERARQVHDKAIVKIYVRIPLMLIEYPECEQLYEENKQLKLENARYKVWLDSLSPDKKKQIHENDILNKQIADVDFSFRTNTLLSRSGIRTVNDLLKFDTASLFAIKGFGASSMVEVEAFLHEHMLQLKRS